VPDIQVTIKYPQGWGNVTGKATAITIFIRALLAILAISGLLIIGFYSREFLETVGDCRDL